MNLTHVGQQSRLQISGTGLVERIQRSSSPFGGRSPTENDCSGSEGDPDSLSIEAAKHFLDEVEPGGSRFVQTTHCGANPYRPERLEGTVTFEGGQVFRVSIDSKFHNVEGQRSLRLAANGASISSPATQAVCSTKYRRPPTRL